jgi:hypothetical protein
VSNVVRDALKISRHALTEGHQRVFASMTTKLRKAKVEIVLEQVEQSRVSSTHFLEVGLHHFEQIVRSYRWHAHRISIYVILTKIIIDAASFVKYLVIAIT